MPYEDCYDEFGYHIIDANSEDEALMIAAKQLIEDNNWEAEESPEELAEFLQIECLGDWNHLPSDAMRLVVEIISNVELKENDLNAISESMDLDRKGLDNLFKLLRWYNF